MSEPADYDYSREICHVCIRDLGGSRSKNLLDNSDLAFRSCISMRWCVIDGLRKVCLCQNQLLGFKKEHRTIFVVELLILWWTHAQWIWTIILRRSQILWASVRLRVTIICDALFLFFFDLLLHLQLKNLGNVQQSNFMLSIMRIRTQIPQLTSFANPLRSPQSLLVFLSSEKNRLLKLFSF